MLRPQRNLMRKNASSTVTYPPGTPGGGKYLEPIPPEDEEAYRLAMLELTGSEKPLEDAKYLPAVVAESVPEPLPDDVVLKVRALLGIKKETWDKDMVEAMKSTFPRFGLTKIVARVCLRTGFESLDHAAKVVEKGREMVENEKIPEIRIASGRVVANAVEAIGKMFPQLMALAEKAADKIEGDNGAPRPKNLPPQLNVQVNVGGATSPASPAPEQKVIDVRTVANGGSRSKNKPPV
jgi:hypothetical protein